MVTTRNVCKHVLPKCNSEKDFLEFYKMCTKGIIWLYSINSNRDTYQNTGCQLAALLVDAPTILWYIMQLHELIHML